MVIKMRENVLKKIYLITIMVYLTCLPLSAMSLERFGSAIRILAVVPILVAVLTFRISRTGDYFKGLYKDKRLLFQLAFTLFACASVIWSISSKESLERALSYVLLFALLYSGSCFEYSAKDVAWVKMALVWGSRLTALVLLRFGGFSEGRLELEGVFSEDPNYLCAYFAFGVIWALQKTLEGKKLWERFAGAVELAIYLTIVFFTGSRGGLLAIGLGLAVYLFLFVIKGGKKTIFKTVLLLAVLTVGVFVIFSFLPAPVQQRLSIKNIVKYNGSERFQIWSEGIEMFFRYPLRSKLVGTGTATVRRAFAQYGYFRGHVMHNMFLETLVELGAVGFAFYSAAIGAFSISALRFKDKFAVAVMATMVVLSLSLSIYTFKPYFNIMLFIVIYGKMKRENDTENPAETEVRTQ